MSKTSPQRRLLLEQLSPEVAEKISTSAGAALNALYVFDATVEWAKYPGYEFRDEVKSVMAALKNYTNDPSTTLTGARSPAKQPMASPAGPARPAPPAAGR